MSASVMAVEVYQKFVHLSVKCRQLLQLWKIEWKQAYLF